MKGFDLSKLRINPSNPFPFSGSDTDWSDFKKKLDRDPEFLEANKIAYDSSRDNLVIAGNKRVQALRELGWKTIPAKYVIDCKDWSEEKRERYIYASNWNIGQWSVEFTDEEQAEEWGITFEEEEEVHLEAQEDDYVPPAEIQTDIVRGDLFELKKGDLCHRLLCGDSVNVDDYSKLFDGKECDLVLTDPPYNVDYTGKTKDSLKIQNDKMSNDDFYQFLYDFYLSAFTYARHGCSIYIFHADSEGHNFRKALIDGGWKLSQCLQWVKNSMVMGRQDYHWKHEPILYGWKEGAAHNWYSDRSQTTTLEFDRPNRNAEHPTMKPIELISYLMSNNSKPGDIILDPFLGSHSTMVAAHQLERNCYGIEIDEKYCQVGIDRMLKLDEDIQLFRNGTDVTEKYRKRLETLEKAS